MNQNNYLAGAALCVAMAFSASAGVFTAGNSGYGTRAELMAIDGLWAGVADQARQADESEQLLRLRALAAFHLNDRSAAKALVGSLVSTYPASPMRFDNQQLEADLLLEEGLYSDALQAYDSLPLEAFDADGADALTMRRAYCRVMLGDYRKARTELEGLAASPVWGNAARFYSAYIDYANGEYRKALAGFRGVDTSTMPGATAPFYIMQIAYATGDYNQARTLARNIIDTKPGAPAGADAEAYRILGEALYQQGQTAEALPYLWQYASMVEKPAPSAFYILGVSEFDQGNWDNAIKVLQQVVPAGGALSQSAYLYLGQAYSARGDRDSALMAFEQAFRQNYDPAVSETAFYNYAVARMEGGRVPFGSSVTLFEQFLQQYPRSKYAPAVQEYIVTGYMTDNDYAAALAAINRVERPTQRLIDAKQRVLFVMGTREYQAGKLQAAESHLSSAAALQANPDIAAQSRLWLGKCRYDRNDYSGAASEFLSYLNATKNSRGKEVAFNRMTALYDLGYARFAERKYEDALTDFRRALSLADTESGAPRLRADIENRIADCHFYASRFAEAEAGYRRAYAINPEAGDYALYQVAIVEGMQDKHAQKIADLDALMSAFPATALAPQALLEKAESLQALGRRKDAIATYRTLVADHPATPAGRNGALQLALACEQDGNREGAIESYKEVIVNYPTSEEARLATDDLKAIYAADGHLNDFTAWLATIPGAPTLNASDLDRAAFQAAEQLYASNGRTDRLESYLREYPKGVGAAKATYYLAQAAWDGGDSARAVKLAGKVASDYPHTEVAEEALLLKGEVEAGSGRHEAALATYSELEQTASDPTTIEQARLGRLRAAATTGRHADVVALADALLASSAGTTVTADAAEVAYLRAVALQKQKQYGRADAELAALAKTPANLYGSMAAVALGQSQLDRGQTASARRTVDALINANPPHEYWLARGFILYSDILRKQGDSFEADQYLRSLRQNYPGKEADIFNMIDKRLK